MIPFKPLESELEALPAVGPSVARYLGMIGVRTIAQMAKSDPEKLYKALCKKEGRMLDPCLLYSLRCACYAARGGSDTRLHSWWKWKDRTL